MNQSAGSFFLQISAGNQSRNKSYQPVGRCIPKPKFMQIALNKINVNPPPPDKSFIEPACSIILSGIL